MNKILIMFIAALSMAACKSATAVKNPANAPVDTGMPQSNTAFFTAVGKPANFTHLKITSKVDVQTGTLVPTADATTYIENGSKVWMNISAVFFNIARGIATQQGIKGYEKIGKNYIDSDFSYLNNLLNVNFLNYNALQNLLCGKTFLPVNQDEFILTKNAEGYLLSSASPKTFSENGISRTYSSKMQYSPTFDLMRVSVQDAKSTDGLDVFYSNRIQIGGDNFPQNVKIVLKGAKQGQISIQNTKFDFSTMETPYSVPANYTKKDIR